MSPQSLLTQMKMAAANADPVKIFVSILINGKNKATAIKDLLLWCSQKKKAGFLPT